MSTKSDQMIQHVWQNFGRIYLGGVPCLLNDDGAFLSFICCLTATEALGGFLKPKEGDSARFKAFVKDYFPDPYPSQADALWKFRNAAVHGFSPGPYKLTHHNSNIHLSTDGGLTVLNAEDFYAVLVTASKRYFDALTKDAALQAAFAERASDPNTGVLIVAPATGKPCPPWQSSDTESRCPPSISVICRAFHIWLQSKRLPAERGGQRGLLFLISPSVDGHRQHSASEL